MAKPVFSLDQYTAWMEDLLEIIFDCRRSLTNLDRLLKEPTSREEQHVLSSGFVQHLRSQYRFTLATQLTKLFSNSPSHERAFPKLLARIKESGLAPEIVGALVRNVHHREPSRLCCSEQDVVNVMEALLLLIDAQALPIERLLKARDKVIAHTDTKKHTITLSMSDVRTLLSLAERIYNTVEGKIFDRCFLFDTTGDWSAEPMVTAWTARLIDQRKHMEQAQ